MYIMRSSSNLISLANVGGFMATRGIKVIIVLLIVVHFATSAHCYENNNKVFTVAQDGSGTNTEIGRALAAAPNYSTTPVYIKLKAGIYKEHVIVPQWKTNIYLVGENMQNTIITGSRTDPLPPRYSNGDTMLSATFAVEADGFVAREVTFENTAGPGAGPAVAFRSVGDKTVLYRCALKGYQDTVFTQFKRHFYRECDIYGTVDFIFGQSLAVFQNCKIFFRAPVPGQPDVLVAQGRETLGEKSGIVLQNCTISKDPNSSGGKIINGAYLARPWKAYSTTVIMESYIDSVVSVQGWLPWEGDYKSLNTVYYAEYNNRGPGSGTTDRVKCSGCKVISSSKEAQSFSVRNFINGLQWLPSTKSPSFLIYFIS